MSQTLSSRAAVTVIIPCYNCVKTIGRAIASVAIQTQLPQQVVLVEDGSSDHGATLGELHRLQQTYISILPIEILALPSNLGVAAARNAAWERATQPYLAFLDADDTWHPRKLELQFKYMQHYPATVLCGHRHRELGGVEIPCWEIGEFQASKLGRLQMLMSNRFITPSVMIKTEVPFRFRSGRRYMEDHLLWMEIICADFSVDRLEIELAAIYKRPFGQDGLSANLWQMEVAELHNYGLLYGDGRLTKFERLALQAFSMLKFVRRIGMVILWGILGRVK